MTKWSKQGVPQCGTQDLFKLLVMYLWQDSQTSIQGDNQGVLKAMYRYSTKGVTVFTLAWIPVVVPVLAYQQPTLVERNTRHLEPTKNQESGNHNWRLLLSVKSS